MVVLQKGHSLQTFGPELGLYMPCGHILNGPDFQPEREQADQQRMQRDSRLSAASQV
jgi:hypothetical protein